MRRTKIVCTIGPSTEQPDVIAELIEQGMDVARLNLSHGCREDHLRRVLAIKEVSRQIRKDIAILIDNRGPEVRIGKIDREPVVLSAGQQFTLTARPVTGDQHQVSITYSGLTREIVPGKMILIDDGLISLEVTAVSGDDIICRVVNGGELYSRKGMNFPGTSISLPAVNQLDHDDLQALLELGIDFVAASFARSWKDIVEVRRLIEKYRGEVKIIAKIESQEGMSNFSSILEAADGVMIARGDLGVEIPAEEVPLIQKRFIRRCNRAGKPVITATQMLDSMIRHPRPTRAEASDVANAIFDGTDAVMLSGETAVGRYPVESVTTLSRIARRTEQELKYKQILQFFETTMEKTITDAISYATCHTAQELNAAAIITSTQSGYTARMVSKYRPQAPIIAVTPSRKVAASLKLIWGVYPVLCPPTQTTDEMFGAAIQASLQEGLIREGDLVVITAGVPVGVPGTTNLLRVETVGEAMVKGTGIGKVAVTGTALVVAGDHLPDKAEPGQILVVKNTDKRYLSIIEQAAALVTEQGGLTSHGAIVALNLNKPAVVGTKQATELICTGDVITVDAIRGLIYRGKATVL